MVSTWCFSKEINEKPFRGLSSLCLHPDLYKLAKRAFQRQIYDLLLTVLGENDYDVGLHSLILKLKTSSYHTL